ncbi:MAG: hypothetical protein BWK78_02415 [Thiotrichaceae bacterium IS1]|nr:MAG: hypothetical protein BWK78_02415 [Thiotrichaceae bacterium IS1]
MLSIHPEQMQSLERDIEQRHKEEFVQQLQQDYPVPTGKMDEQQLQELVVQGYENAKELEFFEKRDIYRFISLNFLPKELLDSPFVQSVLIRVLNNFNCSGTQRMDFIEHNIVHRQFSEVELASMCRKG